MGAVSLLEPIHQAEQIRGKGGEALQLFVLLTILGIPDQTSNDEPFVNI